MRLLVAGYSVRHIACSAARAGHDVIAADCFCDVDLERCASTCVKLEKESAESTVRNCARIFSPDAVVLGPGLEEMRLSGVRILNNPPEKASQVADKLQLYEWLQSKGYPTIPTGTSSLGLRPPLVIKPRKGAGGVGSRVLEPREIITKDIAENFTEDSVEKDVIYQEYTEGLPSSVSVICNGSEAKAIAINEQLIGCTWARAEGFRYSGNITPLEASRSVKAEMAGMAESIVMGLGLLGSNGVDFMLTKEGPVVVEVNPRFQGSLDAVELSTDVNVFEAHLRSFEGLLPQEPVPKRTAGRTVIYAGQDLLIDGIASGSWITDIPRPGSVVPKGEPLASVVAAGDNREEVVKLLKERAAQALRWFQG